MKKFLTFITAVLFAGGMFAEGLLFEQTYPGSPSKFTNAYDATFTITTDSITLTYANINNGGSASANWTAIRAGRKGSASVATVTSDVIASKVSKVVINFTQVNASKTKALYLLVSDNADFAATRPHVDADTTNVADTLQIEADSTNLADTLLVDADTTVLVDTLYLLRIDATIAQGEVVFEIPEPMGNMYYRLVLDMIADGSANGFNRWDKIQFFTPEGGKLLAPVISPNEATIWDSVTVSITAASDANIYYTLDDTDPTVESMEYAGPFVLKQTTVVKAIAARDSVVSPIAMK